MSPNNWPTESCPVIVALDWYAVIRGNWLKILLSPYSCILGLDRGTAWKKTPNTASPSSNALASPTVRFWYLMFLCTMCISRSKRFELTSCSDPLLWVEPQWKCTLCASKSPGKTPPLMYARCPLRVAGSTMLAVVRNLLKQTEAKPYIKTNPYLCVHCWPAPVESAAIDRSCRTECVEGT